MLNVRHSIVFWLLIALGSSPAVSNEAGAYSAAEVRQAMFNAIAAIEEAAALEPTASQGIAAMSDGLVGMLFSSMENNEQFVESTWRIVDGIESARTESQGSAASAGLQPLLSSSSTAPFPPDYPSTQSVNFATAMALGLISSTDERCGGEGLENFESFLAGAKGTLAVAEAACSVAGCDPTGIGCAGVWLIQVSRMHLHRGVLPRFPARCSEVYHPPRHLQRTLPQSASRRKTLTLRSSVTEGGETTNSSGVTLR